VSAEVDFTVDELERIVIGALRSHDVKAVDVAVRLMAVKDAHRAQSIIDTIELGIWVSEETGKGA
jgi:hypothetical protein